MFSPLSFIKIVIRSAGHSSAVGYDLQFILEILKEVFRDLEKALNFLILLKAITTALVRNLKRRQRKEESSGGSDIIKSV